MPGEEEGLLLTFLVLTLDGGDRTASHSDCMKEQGKPGKALE
jgi:hypothetical protein